VLIIWFIDSILVITVLALAWLCVQLRDLFTSILLFICLGLVVTLIWARLNAVDIAIAEAAIGAGLTGALLLAAWHSIQRTPNNNRDNDHED
jgi:uncharacterized MnhB-related membrane protein